MKSYSRTKPGTKLLRRNQQKLFERFRANPKLWIERTVKLKDKDGVERPFIFNNIQAEYYDILIALYWKPYKTVKGRVIYRFQGIREVNLKARQFGLSSLICALLLHDTIFFRNTKTYIFCQDEGKSNEMLKDRVKFYFDSINREDPLIVLPDKTTWNTSEIAFATKSEIYARTPGSSEGVARKAGRSVTLRNALLSEMAEMEDAATLWQGLAPALLSRTTNIFIESSPYIKKSGPFFRSLYDSGKLPGGTWNSRFWPWWKFNDYAIPFESSEELEAFQESLTEVELKEIELYNLSLEKVNWRRYMISFLGGGNKGEKRFRHDFPANETEGFKVSDEKMFFADADSGIDLFKVLAEPQEPVPGRMYVIAVDVAQGDVGTVPDSADYDSSSAKGKKKSKKRDSSCIHVYDTITGAQVYRYSVPRRSIRTLHREIHSTFIKYPGLVLIEANGLGQAVLALVRLIKDRFFQRMIYRSSESTDGFWTGNQKDNLLYELRERLEEAVRQFEGLGENTDPDIWHGIRFAYQETVTQMGYFAYLEDGTLGAVPGQHDDEILAAMIGAFGLKVATRYRKHFEKHYKHRVTTTEVMEDAAGEVEFDGVD
jgi:hypothetical protein